MAHTWHILESDFMNDVGRWPIYSYTQHTNDTHSTNSIRKFANHSHRALNGVYSQIVEI